NLLDAIDTAVEVGVLQGGILHEAFNTDQLQLRFVHPMAIEVITQQMKPSEQRDYHQRIAEYAETYSERLLHRAAATLTRDDVLAGKIIRMAERYGRMGRWEQAARSRIAAARLLSSEAQREHEILEGVDALASAGRINEAVQW